MGASCGRRTLDEMAAKRARRLALLEAAGGHEPSGTGTPCADCEAPRTILNTSVAWSDAAKTRLTFHYTVCDAGRSATLKNIVLCYKWMLVKLPLLKNSQMTAVWA